jgi:S-DNA-T family DNA segregation ATPase FtsK/SpoIIIE
MARAQAADSVPAASTKTTQTQRHDLRAEMIGLVLLFAGLAFGAALVTYSPHDMELIHSGRAATEELANLIGPVGARIADLLLQLLGVGAFLLDALLLVLAVRTLTGRFEAPRLRTGMGVLGAAMATMIFLHLGAQKFNWRPFGKDAAGLMPGAVAVLCKALLSVWGTLLLAGWMMATSLAAMTGRSLVRGLLTRLGLYAKPVVERAASAGADVARSGIDSIRQSLSRSKMPAAGPLRGLDESDFDPARGSDLSASVAELEQMWGNDAMAAAAIPPAPSEPAVVDPTVVAKPEAQFAAADLRAQAAQASHSPGVELAPKPNSVPTAVRRLRELEAQREAAAVEPVDDPGRQTARMDSRDVRIALADLEGQRMPVDEADLAPLDEAHIQALVGDVEAELPPPVPAETKVEQARVAGGPRIVMTEAMKNTPLPAPTSYVQGDLGLGGKAWVLPGSMMCQEPPARVLECDASVLQGHAAQLCTKLAEFSIQGEVTDIRPGPVVTTYEFRPAPGVKISKIVGLKDDLTMSLSALRVRIVAPIPGRDVVGIEVPNSQRQTVYFREVIDSPVFRESQGPLTLVLGKDIEGRPVCTDLGKAPHMLVAGSTGTGKSVGINSFIASVLFRATPDEVKFVFVDPKMVELSVYADIPHLLVPVVTDMRHADLALKWCVGEMERRYKLLQKFEVRNLAGYKQKLPEVRADVLRRRADAQVRDMEGNLGVDADLDVPEDLPYIVVVIDEFADLIMAAGKEVETSVGRLAQKARAAGIHVILATQRPSVDVLTGFIRANFPMRVAFQVSSAMDSKVVLDTLGAETLLGRGDMLFKLPTDSQLRRAHGTWITDDEVVALAKHWKEQGAPKYDMDILRDPEQATESDDEGDDDNLMDDAVRAVRDAQQASVSFLQRKLGIGYGRAARMIDTMEKRGIVGPSRGPNKPREVLG